jgi:hypothetical protein
MRFMIPGLYDLFLKRLCEIKTKKEVIPYDLIFPKICRSFSITKDECRLTLMFFAEMKFVEIHKNGIKILKRKIPRTKEIKLLASDVPKTCNNHCDKCGKMFEAKITIQDTCKDCSEKENQKIKEKVKKEIENGNTNPEWVLTLQALMGN